MTFQYTILTRGAGTGGAGGAIAPPIFASFAEVYPY